MFEVRSGELVVQLGGELLGDAALVLCGIAALEDAGAADIAFLADARQLKRLQHSSAGCVIVGPALREAMAHDARDRHRRPLPVLRALTLVGARNAGGLMPRSSRQRHRACAGQRRRLAISLGAR
jgi:hypothetical protein